MSRTEQERLDDNIQRVELEEGIDITPTSLEEAFTARYLMVHVDSGVDGDWEAWDKWFEQLYIASKYHEVMTWEIPDGMYANTYEITFPDVQVGEWVANIWPEGRYSDGEYFSGCTFDDGYYCWPYAVVDKLLESALSYTNYGDDDE